MYKSLIADGLEAYKPLNPGTKPSIRKVQGNWDGECEINSEIFHLSVKFDYDSLSVKIYNTLSKYCDYSIVEASYGQMEISAKKRIWFFGEKWFYIDGIAEDGTLLFGECKNGLPGETIWNTWLAKL